MKKETTIPSQEVQTEASLAHRRRMTSHFLRGPIPIIDLALASRLGGHSLTVLLIIHHRAAMTKNRSVTLPATLLARFGVSRDTKARALHALQKESLIAVERDLGKTARVTLLPNPNCRFEELFVDPAIRSVD
jgi:hypothetical protein